MTTTISVVLPNYNGRDLLESFLPYTFEALEKSGKRYELILVDDASTDASVEWLTSNFPQIQLIQNPQNLGFSKSCNRGIAAATGDFVFLLNSDIQLSPNYFESQFELFEKEDTFGVMGQILGAQTRSLEIGAKIPRWVGLKLKSDRQYLPNEAAGTGPTLFLSGANALIDRRKLQLLGGFDEVYTPYYSEDLDLSVRAWKMGWKSYLNPKSVCFHLGSSSIKSSAAKEKIKKVYFRNRMVFHAIHLDSHQVWKWKIQNLLTDVLPKLLLGKLWIYQSYREFKALEPKIRESRTRLAELSGPDSSQKSLHQVEQDIRGLLPVGAHIKVKL